jgi:allantoicase
MHSRPAATSASGAEVSFADLVDLASERVGGEALVASDDFFAEKENLLREGRGVFIEDKFTDRGKWMDGWETRRRRTPGHDWCVIRLGVPGVIRGLVVDTNHFNGNQPETCTVDACVAPDDATAMEMGPLDDDPRWTRILDHQQLGPSAEHRFEVESSERYTHVRLNIYPDGGVARFRVYGEARPDWDALRSRSDAIDLACMQNGGRALACNDMHFSHKDNLILPGDSRNMGDGWETRRRRSPGCDWNIVQLGHRGTVERVIVDTMHFKGNYPDSCLLEWADLDDDATARLCGAPESGDVTWHTLVPQTKLQADTKHEFTPEGDTPPTCTHVRLTIYPDGGVARLRVLGRPV